MTQTKIFVGILAAALTWWAIWASIVYTLILPGTEFPVLIASTLGLLMASFVWLALLLIHALLSGLWVYCGELSRESET